MFERRGFVLKEKTKRAVSCCTKTFVSQAPLHYNGLLSVNDFLINFASIKQNSEFKPLAKASRGIDNLPEFLTWSSNTESQISIHLLTQGPVVGSNDLCWKPANIAGRLSPRISDGNYDFDRLPVRWCTTGDLCVCWTYPSA